MISLLFHLVLLSIMPVVGLEPTLRCHKQILSLPRLPIPTHRRMFFENPNN